MQKLIEKIFGMTQAQSKTYQAIRQLVDANQYTFNRLENYIYEGESKISYQIQFKINNEIFLIDTTLSEQILLVVGDTITGVQTLKENNSAHLKELIRNLAYSDLATKKSAKELVDREHIQRVINTLKF